MEPRTSNVEGEKSFVDAGHEVGVEVAYNTPHRAETTVPAVLPVTGVDLSAYNGGLAGALIAGGFALCIMAAVIRRRR